MFLTKKRFRRVAFFITTVFLLLPGLAAAQEQPTTTKTIAIPRLSQAPTLENFLGMTPHNGSSHEMAKVEDFIQKQPKDGDPATQKTEVYLGYDDKNFYVVFVCFD